MSFWGVDLDWSDAAECVELLRGCRYVELQRARCSHGQSLTAFSQGQSKEFLSHRSRCQEHIEKARSIHRLVLKFKEALE